MHAALQLAKKTYTHYDFKHEIRIETCTLNPQQSEHEIHNIL